MKKMIINVHSKIGLFEKKEVSNENGLFIFDFSTQEKNYIENYSEWKAKSLSSNGERIAITTISSSKKSYRTELVVMEHKNQKVLLNTHNYYVYDVAFSQKGNKMLVITEQKKPFCYDLTSNEITAEMPRKIRTYRGDLDLESDIFIAPCENIKDTCYVFDFNTNKTEVVKLGTKAKINRIKFSTDFSAVYAITETNILYCFDKNYKIKWSKDFNYLGKQGGRINSSNIFSTEDGRFLGVYSSSTEANNWGSEYVIDSTNGEIIRQIENYQFRGRFATDFFDNRVLLHTFKTIDLTTGEVSENLII